MAQSAPLVLRLLASSVTAGTRAGKIIKDVLTSGDLGIVDKGIKDLQTEADRSAQRCIVASLARQFPNVKIIGEEGSLTNLEVPSDWIVTDCDSNVISQQCPADYLQVKDEDIVIWVDPLDGTNEYTQGFLEHVTVLVGLSIKGKAVGGVIHQPYYNYKKSETTGRTIWGLIGIGAGEISSNTPPPNKFIVVTSRTHSDKLVESAISALKPDETLKVGGAGYKVLALIEGQAHAYVFASKGCKKWDTCAPEGILRACGGKLTDIHGDDYQYHENVSFPNSRGVFATARGVNHDELIARIPAEVKNVLQ